MDQHAHTLPVVHAASKRTFVLVHGAWHGAWCFERLAALLAGAGHAVTARDLPGHGLNARFPDAYSVFPRDGALQTEASPLAGITLADYTASVVDIIDGLLAAGQPPPVLVGHSMGGLVVQAVAEALGPTKIHHLVYVAAFMPRDEVPLIDYFMGPPMADSLLGPLVQADPHAVGAIRLDPRSGDAAYLAQLQAAFYGDVDAATARAATLMLTPDIPVAPGATPLRLSLAGWGAVPRTYVRCANDLTVPPGCQDLMIAQADAFSPANATRVVTLDSGHSPFLSQPRALADALLALPG